MNTGHTADAAANLGKPLLDADYAGRAIPEAQCVTPAMFGKSMAPFAAVDYYGDVTIVKRTANNTMAERLGKFIATAAFGHVGCAAIPLDGATVKRIAVPGTLTEALSSVAQSAAPGRGADPVSAIPNAIRRARPVPRRWPSAHGRTVPATCGVSTRSTAATARVGSRCGSRTRTTSPGSTANPYVASPDVIEIVDDKTGEPRVNTDIEIGDRVAVLGVNR